jgi:hypothetical protein
MSIEQMVHYQSKLSYELDSADLFLQLVKKKIL